MASDPKPNRITEIESEQAALREQMKGLAAQWQQAAVTWIRKEWEYDGKSARERNPEALGRLAAGPELAKLKNDLEHLIEDAPRVVAQMFENNDKVWCHVHGTVFALTGCSPPSANAYFYDSQDGDERPPMGFDGNQLRFLRGKALALLADAGLSAIHDAKATRSGGNYRYPSGLSWSSDMGALIREYSQPYQAYVNLAEELQRIRDHTQREEGEQFWDEA